MFLKREGFPDEGEFVNCLVTSVQYNSVFVKIDEFGGKSGLIHISEISPGRIRNIRDYVREGKMVVCKVIGVNESKGHIDLSLRRVTEIQRRNKVAQRKQEQKAEKLVEMLAEELGEDTKAVYSVVSKALFKDYELLQYAFEDVVETGAKLVDSGLDEKYANPLEIIVKDKIKPKQVVIGGELEVKSYDPNGVEVVRRALMDAESKCVGSDIKYLGAGKYRVTVEAKDYKKAEPILKDLVDMVSAGLKAGDGSASFKRKEI